jgi:hypothetical protein
MLTIELIPKTSFFKNLRSELSQQQWDLIRRAIYKRANYRCEIENCGGKGSRHPVECHEIWEYSGSVQKLVGLIALCPKCHMVKHWGLTQMRGLEHVAFEHLRHVNNWSVQQAQKHVMEAVEIWQARNKIQWVLDISWVAENFPEK